MKLSKLKKIIRESLNSLNEQPGFPNPKLCRVEDFKATGQCAQDHFFNSPMGNLGGPTSFDSWLSNQWNAYSGRAGCYQFGAIMNWTLSQITPTTNCPALPGMSAWGPYGGEKPNGQCRPLIQVKRKFAKSKWAYCMKEKCCRDVDDPNDSFRCLDGTCVSCGGPGCQYATIDECEKDCGPRDEPCRDFLAATPSMQNGCCGKCINGVYTGTAGDPCDVLTQSCKCCDDTRGDDPCKDNPTEECYWCQAEQGSSCVPVGTNLTYALANGFSLYSDPADCNSAEPRCGGIDPVRDIECHRCDLNGYPVGNMFPGPNCPAGWQTMPPFNPASCKPNGPDPSDPVDMVDPGMERMKNLMEYKKPK